MADHLGSPRHDPPPPRGLLERARGHLVDVTPLRTDRDFRRLFLGRSVSDFGDEIVMVVVAFQVYDITRSPLAVGMLGFAELIPVFVFPILGGAFADALERRRLTITTHAILAVMSVLMAWNASLDTPMLWPLYVFAFLSAGLATFNRPALDTWPARLLDKQLLPSANALEAGFGTLDSMLGPVAAGILLATVAPAGAFVFDAVTFLVVIAMIVRMRPSPPSDEGNEVSWEAIKDGFRFLKGKKNLQSLFLADLNAMIFGFPIALFPPIAESIRPGQPGVLGLFYAAPAAGAFIATMVSGRAKHVRRQGRAILAATGVWGAAIIVFGFSNDLWLALAMLAVAGAGDMVSGIFRMSIIQTAVEDRIRGRLDGIAMAVWATGPAVGNIESGVVATLTTPATSVVAGGVLTIVGVGVLRLALPGFVRYDSQNPEP
jgi:MFS family permease